MSDRRPGPQHFVTVTEHHRITEPAPDIRRMGERVAMKRLAWSRCRRAALTWAEHTGVQITPQLLDSGGCWGVSFDLVLSAGDDAVPPSRWVWSARWRDWCAVLARMRDSEAAVRGLTDRDTAAL